MSSWRRCSDVFQLRYRNDDSDEKNITVKDRSSALTEQSAVRHTFEKKLVKLLHWYIIVVQNNCCELFLITIPKGHRS